MGECKEAQPFRTYKVCQEIRLDNAQPEGEFSFCVVIEGYCFCRLQFISYCTVPHCTTVCLHHSFTPSLAHSFIHSVIHLSIQTFIGYPLLKTYREGEVAKVGKTRRLIFLKCARACVCVCVCVCVWVGHMCTRVHVHTCVNTTDCSVRR